MKNSCQFFKSMKTFFRKYYTLEDLKRRFHRVKNQGCKKLIISILILNRYNIMNNLKERIEWALHKPDDITSQPNITKAEQRKNHQENEKKWGNDMIGQTNNGQWTTLLGERLVYDVLMLRGENPRRVVKKEGFEPDWETDDFIYEVKTSNWWVSGTAGEKVLGTWIKYQKVPTLYGKPLKIVVVANQEYEMEYGKTKYFGDHVTEKTRQVLDLAASWNIQYIRFSELVAPVYNDLINNS